MKIVLCKKPKGFFCTHIYFSRIEDVEDYTNSIKKEFLLNKARMLEYPNLSKRIKKIIKFTKPKEHVLTKQGSKLLLWQR